jgi:hypothetical protein
VVYILMIYSKEADWAWQTPEQMLPTLQAHRALEDELRAAGKFRGGGGLALTDSAATVRFPEGRPTVTDGPFAETKEQFGGFYLVEAEDREEALSYAQRISGVPGRAIEVRPFLHFSAP